MRPFRGKFRAAVFGGLLWVSACGGAFREPTLQTDELTPDAGSPESERAVSESKERVSEPPRLRAMGETEKAPESRSSSVCEENPPLPSGVSRDAGAAKLRAIGRDYLLSGKHAEALAVLKAAERSAPNDPMILSDTALALLRCKMIDAAVDRAERASQAAPDNADILSNLGEIYRIAGRIEEGIRVYREAAERGVADAGIYNNLSVLLLAEGDAAAAEKAVRKATALAPDSARYLINLGYVLLRQNRLPDAEMVLRRAVEMTPEDPDAHNQLGVVLTLQKRELEAEKCFKRALALDPNHKAAKENLGAADRRPFQFENQ